MTMSMTAMWKTAADSMWGSTNWCVSGGLGQGTIGQMKTMGQGKRAAPVMTSSFAMVNKGFKLAINQVQSLMTTLDVFTESDSSKLWSKQGLMRP